MWAQLDETLDVPAVKKKAIDLGKNSAPEPLVECPTSEMLCGRFELLRTLKHRGATGVLYYARDHEPKSELGGSRLVLKIEDSSASKKQMENELQVYQLWNKNESIRTPTNHVGCIPPARFSPGAILTAAMAGQRHETWSKKVKVLAMKKLGKNLSQLMKQKGKMGEKTVLMLGVRMMDLLERLHTTGYVHGDIKPENFCIGLKMNAPRLYMIDFGVACRYCDEKGAHYASTEKADASTDKKVVGSLRYASIHAHKHGRRSRRCDVEATAYTLLFMLKGSLPWQSIKSMSRNELGVKIAQFKMRMPLNTLCRGCPAIKQVFTYCATLKHEDKPDYSMLKNIFVETMKKRGIKDDGLYEWDRRDLTRIVADSEDEEEEDTLPLEASAPAIPMAVEEPESQFAVSLYDDTAFADAQLRKRPPSSKQTPKMVSGKRKRTATVSENTPQRKKNVPVVEDKVTRKETPAKRPSSPVLRIKAAGADTLGLVHVMTQAEAKHFAPSHHTSPRPNSILKSRAVAADTPTSKGDMKSVRFSAEKSVEVVVEPFKAYNQAAQEMVKQLQLSSRDEADSSVLRWSKLLTGKISSKAKKSAATIEKEKVLVATLKKVSKFLTKDQKFVKASKLLRKLIKTKLTEDNSKMFLAPIGAALGNGSRLHSPNFRAAFVSLLTTVHASLEKFPEDARADLATWVVRGSAYNQLIGSGLKIRANVLKTMIQQIGDALELVMGAKNIEGPQGNLFKARIFDCLAKLYDIREQSLQPGILRAFRFAAQLGTHFFLPHHRKQLLLWQCTLEARRGMFDDK